jgi:hypothetical protein
MMASLRVIVRSAEPERAKEPALDYDLFSNTSILEAQPGIGCASRFRWNICVAKGLSLL